MLGVHKKVTRKPKSPRELVARALCRAINLPPDTKLDGAPLRATFLPEVDAMLEAAPSPEE